jgi:hypothetical protein
MGGGRNLNDSQEAEPLLLTRSWPDIYRVNSFRLSQLPVDAGTREISKRQQMLALAQATGMLAPPGPGRALPIKGGTEAGSVRDALQHLRDPTQRIVDEVFWFWPHKLGKSAEDEALKELTRGKAEAAEEIWKQQESSSEANVSMHNLAILAHVKALDVEHQVAEGKRPKETKEDLDKLWQSAMKRWKVLSQHEHFWSRLTARIRDIDDPRLTTGTARRIRGSLPVALLLINARLAIQYYEQGKPKEAKRQVDIIRSCGFAKEDIDEAMKIALQPVRDRIKMLCKKLDGEGDADPEHADGVVDRLLEQTKQPLALLDLMLDKNNATRIGARDEVAQCALGCQITYGNKTENWRRSRQLLEQTMRVAASETLRSRIEQNMDIVQRNEEWEKDHGTCWYCRRAEPEDSLAHEVKMYGNVVREPNYLTNTVRIRWNVASVLVPRCRSCWGAHRRVNQLTALVGILATVLALVVLFQACTGAENEDDAFGIVIGGGIVGLIFVFIAAGLANFFATGFFCTFFRRKGESGVEAFGRIQALKSQGWSVGAGPSTE